MTEEFTPSWSHSPGEYIRELINDCGKSVEKFANALGVPIEWAEKLLEGEVLLDSSIANQLGALFGDPPNWWLRKEDLYRKDCERLGKDVWWSYTATGARVPPAYVRFDEPGFWGVK